MPQSISKELEQALQDLAAELELAERQEFEFSLGSQTILVRKELITNKIKCEVMCD
jgi:hypothetical protein